MLDVERERFMGISGDLYGTGSSVLEIYIYYIQPELRIANCRSGSGKGAGGSIEGARRSIERARGSTMGQCRGSAGKSLKWLPRSRLELPSLLFCCLDFAEI